MNCNTTHYRANSSSVPGDPTCMAKSEDLQYSVVESHLSENVGRNKQLFILIQEALNKGRTTLFLGKRKDLLKKMAKRFKEYRPMLVISETNKRTEEEERYLQNDCKLILGIFALAKEGLDLDRLDLCIISGSMADVEQAVGRISRLHPDKKPPLAIYLLDDSPMLYATFHKAQKSAECCANFIGHRTLTTIKTLL